MNKVIIVGHKNPDTDSIVSAIVAEEFFSRALGKNAKAYRAGMINNETKFVLENIGAEIPEMISEINDGDSVALVDHNQISQVFEGLDYSSVDFIIDHHNLNVQTEKPIFCRMAPLGSTSSVIAQLFFEDGLKPSEKAAKLLISGILSDTLNLTSPTTTEEDKNLVGKLNEIAQLDIDAFASEMFKAKSSLEGISIDDVINLDYKIFEMGKYKVGIGTWETTLPESVNVKKDEISKALVVKKEAEKMDFMFFMVVDILQQNCQLYLVGNEEKNLAEKVFGGKVENDMMSLPGVVSRKKQIVPQLTQELSK
ncbi:MAG: Manganese-dependent inorganic pyrophosphatase [uncultured bacterium]|nr:MAG: Manganese-dependent inorganic pyrophosphatase [uncultured bacterium]